MNTSRVEEVTRQMEERVEEQVKAASQRFEDVTKTVASFVKEHPAASLVGAFAIGYIIARAARHA